MDMTARIRGKYAVGQIRDLQLAGHRHWHTGGAHL